MGQILRNFPGSLFGDLKIKLAEESYTLGLRILQGLLNIAEVNLEEFRSHYKKVIKERRGSISEGEAASTADGLIILLTSGASFGIIKRISAAIGHDQLQDIYADVRRNLGPLTSVELIDLSIKLDHFRGIPNTEINKLEKKTSENKFGYRILRDLIAHFLYLFAIDESDRQKLVSKFDITTPQTKLLLNDSKRTNKKISKKKGKRKVGT
jgi:hypothetical protein